ncbi:MAG: VWA domain-containing protein [Dehalococcoidia bacterium]|nr:VWA domain-containing protein [Dehalococcoidia bacterium]
MESARNLQALEQELQRFPPSVLEEFGVASQRLSGSLAPKELQAWGKTGVAIAQQTIRSWEVAAEYFRLSPYVLEEISFPYFLAWAQSMEELCHQSPPVALAYLRAGLNTLKVLPQESLATWTTMGQRLYRGTWKSSILAARFFELSPVLLRTISLTELGRLAALIDKLSEFSTDIAQECLSLSAETLPKMQDASRPLLKLLSTVADKNWRDTKACLEGVAKALPQVDSKQRTRFLLLAEQVAAQGTTPVAGFMVEASQALNHLPAASQVRLLEMCEGMLQSHPALMADLFRSGPVVLARLREEQAQAWFDEGRRLLAEHPEAGAAFFKMESSHAEQMLEELSSSVELAKIRDLLKMYSRALAGTNVEIAASSQLAQRGIGWVDETEPTTEGSSVFLPPVVDRHPRKEENFGWYKVVCTHQVAHLEFGSFTFVYERPSVAFRDLRPKLASRPKVRAQGQPAASAPGQGWITDMQRFFDLFPERRMALDVFTLVEDGRLDARVKQEYAGLRPSYQGVQQETLAARAQPQERPAREMLVEFLLQISLEPKARPTIPSKYREQARKIARVARRVFRPGTMVEDTAEATVRIYTVLAAVPNEEVPQQQQEQFDDNAEQESQQESEGESQEFLQQFQAAQGEQGEQAEQQQEQSEGQGSPEEQPYNSPQDVDYRGAFKPEMAQLLSKLRQGQQQQQGQMNPEQLKLSQEQLQQMLEQSAELEKGEGEAGQRSAALFANNLMREAGMPQNPTSPSFGQGPFIHVDEEGGPLETNEPNARLYHEWDFRAGDYKPRWCLVREKVVPEGEITFWRQTLGAYSSLLNEVRRQFEQMMPESFRRVKRQPDGDEFDLDATLEAVIDKRAGITPSDKVYWRRNKVQRDVAVALLLDMSASTAEAIEETSRLPDDTEAPSDPSEYIAWLRARRGEGVRRQHKRIIDIEKESTVLLMQALELLDDRFGIYGFSGYGRENVEFSVIKEMDERLTDSVKRRVDRIAPMHATRMGPAIRHATWKLQQVDAKTKVLFLLSDGRPQDRGYSREGVEKEYAVHDTKRALSEARQSNIVPFCLTVDKAGHDYLKTMCQDMGYEVLADIYTLPERLPYLYRRLTF